MGPGILWAAWLSDGRNWLLSRSHRDNSEQCLSQAQVCIAIDQLDRLV